MKNVLLFFSVSLIVFFWPISFLVSNPKSWFIYFLPLVIVMFSYLLYRKGTIYHYLILLLIPLTIVFVSPKAFYNYSIFTPDPLKFDTLIKKINLIPQRNIARVYQNRLTVPVEKYLSNIFLFLDPNNYFFALHPRELVGENQNLQKYPFLAIFFFLFGLLHLPQNKDFKWVAFIFLISVTSLSFINNPDKFDIVLLVPISIVTINGLTKFMDSHKKLSLYIVPIFILFSSIELIRIILIK